MIAVLFILAATLTLLPAVLGKLGPKVDKLALPVGPPGRAPLPAFAAWGERLWRHPYSFGALALIVLVALIVPVFGLKTGMPSIKVVPSGDSSRTGYNQVQQAFGTGAPGAVQIVTAQGDAARVTAIAKADPGVAQVMPADARCRRHGARAGRAEHRPVRPRRPAPRSTGCARALPRRRARRRLRRREPRPRARCCRPRRRSSSASC